MCLSIINVDRKEFPCNIWRWGKSREYTVFKISKKIRKKAYNKKGRHLTKSSSSQLWPLALSFHPFRIPFVHKSHHWHFQFISSAFHCVSDSKRKLNICVSTEWENFSFTKKFVGRYYDNGQMNGGPAMVSKRLMTNGGVGALSAGGENSNSKLVMYAHGILLA